MEIIKLLEAARLNLLQVHFGLLIVLGSIQKIGFTQKFQLMEETLIRSSTILDSVVQNLLYNSLEL